MARYFLVFAALFLLAAAPRAHAADTAPEVEKAIARLSADPAMARILKDVPGARDKVRRILSQTHAKGGVEALKTAPARLREKFVYGLLPLYLPQARNQDLVAFATAGRDIAVALAEKAPAICHAWVAAPGAQGNAAFEEAAGKDAVTRLGDAVTAVIAGAYEEIPEFDTAAAEAALSHLLTAIAQMQPDGLKALLTGAAEAQTDEEKKAICAYNASVQSAILALPNAADALRAQFILARTPTSEPQTSAQPAGKP